MPRRLAFLDRSPDRRPGRSAIARRPLRPALLLVCLAALVASAGSLGCATRTRDDRIINRYGLDVYLRSERKLFGAGVDRGYAHPSDISAERLENILGSLLIERRVGARSKLEPAIPAEILAPVCQGLAQAFREADSSERIAVVAQRKQMQKMIFDRKFLTSFVTWIEGDELIFHLSRSDWPLDEKWTNKDKDRLPSPHADDPQEKFRIVTNAYVRRSGRTGVAVDWRSDVFQSFSAAAIVRTAPPTDPAPAPGSKTVLGEGAAEELPPLEPLTPEQLESLDPADLRSLADLEEARTAGRITEAEYRRSRQALLDAAAAD